MPSAPTSLLRFTIPVFALLPLFSCSNPNSGVLPRICYFDSPPSPALSRPLSLHRAQHEIAAAASAFLASLSSSPDLLARAHITDFSDPRRTDWHFVPRPAPTGVSFADLSDSQKIAARNLLRSALSSQGLSKVEEIMLLESVLRDLEQGTGGGPNRDPLAYSITIFGTPPGALPADNSTSTADAQHPAPSATHVADSTKTSENSTPEGADSGGRWAWKLEGHHISLNFTFTGAAADEHDQAEAHHHHDHAEEDHHHMTAPVGFSSTPAFLGSNPAQILSGPRAGTRILAREEDLARKLLLSLSPAQRSQAVLSDTAPADIQAVPGRNLDDVFGSGGGELDTLGLPVAVMTPDQQHLVGLLLFEFLGNLSPDLAETQFQRILTAGGLHPRSVTADTWSGGVISPVLSPWDSIRFVWMGGTNPGEGHYYRLSGPTFIIEYDNTQNHANHVHTLFRDRTNDFGAEDLLKEHYEKDHTHADK